jgi:hypothetical protein
MQREYLTTRTQLNTLDGDASGGLNAIEGLGKVARGLI